MISSQKLATDHRSLVTLPQRHYLRWSTFKFQIMLTQRQMQTQGLSIRNPYRYRITAVAIVLKVHGKRKDQKMAGLIHCLKRFGAFQGAKPGVR